MYLLDTNIISELRRPHPHPAVREWVRGAPPEQLFLSAVTIGEIQRGIEITRQQDPAKADEIEAWLDRLPNIYRVLAVDGTAFREWARLMLGQSDTLVWDALIAAVAHVHGLTVVTRNTRDFEQLGAPTLNPFTESADARND